MRVFAVSGYSGTGKTTLVALIIKALVESEYTVASLKSSIHPLRPEPGTDTWKHEQAGASMTIFRVSNAKSIGFKQQIGTRELTNLAKHDFLIIEGMKSVNIPKFWCVGDSEVRCDDVPVNTQAIVSWSDSKTEDCEDIRIINADDIDELFQIVITRASHYSEIE
jgi:molybdopterin-guanine dinucleotide biosynthesis protein B